MANTTQILRLTCTHDYFSGAIAGLRLQPTKATERWAGSHRVLMRNLPADMTLFSTSETPEDYKELLTFFLVVNDTQFYNYTMLPPVSTKDKLCYLSNKDGKLNAATAIEDSDFIAKIYNIVLHENNAGEEKPLRITNQADDVFVEISWNGRSSLFSYINDLPPGKYNWTYGEEQGYFLGAPETMDGVFGLVEIDLNTLQDTEIRIHFNVRASVWEYYIIDKRESGNGYEITDQKSKYQFKTLGRTSVLGGKSAVKITSEAPIPFKEYPDYEFKLITTVSSGMRQPWNASIALPTAKSEHLKLFGEEESEYITPIYIYI